MQRADEGTPPGPYAETIIKSVQKALTQLGYAAGSIDGHMSPDTSAAIRKFEAPAALARVKDGSRESSWPSSRA